MFDRFLKQAVVGEDTFGRNVLPCVGLCYGRLLELFNKQGSLCHKIK